MQVGNAIFWVRILLYSYSNSDPDPVSQLGNSDQQQIRNKYENLMKSSLLYD